MGTCEQRHAHGVVRDAEAAAVAASAAAVAVTSRHADSESETEWGQDCIAMDENPQSIWHLKPTAVDKN